MEERQLYEREDSMQQGVAALRALRADVAAGDTNPGGLLLYRGRAGFGKTSLLHRLRTVANSVGPDGRKDILLLHARAGEQQKDAAFHVARSLLQPTLAKMTEAERREIFGAWYDIAAPALGLVPPQPGDQPADAYGVLEALSWVVTQLAVNRGPVLMVVDDLHWADKESLGWLTGYIGQISPLPLLVALAYRNEELPDGIEDGLREELRQLGGRGQLIELGRLGRSAVDAMVRNRLGEDADDLFCHTCWTITEGNPLEVSNLIDRLREGKLEAVDENIDQLRSLVAQGSGPAIGKRLERLGTDVQRGAFAAAVLDTAFELETISRVAGLPLNQAETAVTKLVEESILTRNGREYQFVHPTVASAVYQSITFPAMRTSIHGRAADEVINAGKGMAAASRHLIQLHPDDNPQVVEQLRTAAHEHLAMGAPEAARGCLERALREPPADEEVAEIRYELASSVRLIDPGYTVNQLRLAMKEVPGLDEGLREKATMRLGQALTHTNRVQDAVTVTGAEIARMPDGPAKTRLQAASFMWRLLLRNEVDGKETSRQLDVLAAQHLAGRDDGSRAVQVLRAWDLTMRGENSTQALALAEHGLERGLPADGLGWTNQAWGFEIPVMLGVTYIYNDRLDRARDLFADAAREFELMGWSGGHLGFANFFQALVLFRLGKLVDAEKFLHSTLRKSERSGRGMPLQWDIVAVLVDTMLAQGRITDAVRLAAEHEFRPANFPPAPVLPDAPALYGKLLLAQGRRAEAAVELQKAGDSLEARGWQNTVWSPWLSHLAVAIKDTEPERARALAAEAYKRASRAGTNSAEGMALRHCAQVAEPGNEVDLLAQAVGLLGQSPAAYEHAQALVDYGAALRRVGRLRDAVVALDQGLEISRGCGATSLVDRARRELQASGVSPHKLRPLPSRDLTAPQLHAARLTAAGKDVHQVAESMSITPHRVQELLAAVYRTLGTDPKGLADTLRDDPGLEATE
ncbi:ATP-binding protein [Streptacidiphilus fuscans]|uniref:AAA family ATPase n=1 Tax=Streptacidiphilus fuscans TaxID=2789292 RepID=A0A931B571_9ACTN|nr:AAA family ATPase [Streptacidiphilus fuscans]MBF9070569.1 AAA family ATPase [Streptacidiphilus fuscans]